MLVFPCFLPPRRTDHEEEIQRHQHGARDKKESIAKYVRRTLENQVVFKIEVGQEQYCQRRTGDYEALELGLKPVAATSQSERLD